MSFFKKISDFSSDIIDVLSGEDERRESTKRRLSELEYKCYKNFETLDSVYKTINEDYFAKCCRMKNILIEKIKNIEEKMNYSGRNVYRVNYLYSKIENLDFDINTINSHLLSQDKRERMLDDLYSKRKEVDWKVKETMEKYISFVEDNIHIQERYIKNLEVIELFSKLSERIYRHISFGLSEKIRKIHAAIESVEQEMNNSVYVSKHIDKYKFLSGFNEVQIITIIETSVELMLLLDKVLKWDELNRTILDKQSFLSFEKEIEKEYLSIIF